MGRRLSEDARAPWVLGGRQLIVILQDGAGRLKAALQERIVIQAKWYFRGTDKSSKDSSYGGTDFVRGFGKYLSKTRHQEAKRHFPLFSPQANDDEDELEEESDSEPSSCASPRRATSCL